MCDVLDQPCHTTLQHQLLQSILEVLDQTDGVSQEVD